MKKCKNCESLVLGQKRLCDTCIRISDNKSSRISKKVRGKKRKIELIKLHGNKCIMCNEIKPISCMCFHHVDSNKKLFTLDRDMLSKKSWNEILQESEKCDLLCQNCHLIIHEKERSLFTGQKQITIKLKAKYLERKKMLLDLKNNKCEKCSYSSEYIQCFHFHHIDPSTKKFHLNCTKLASKSIKDIMLEFSKCQLLCANCHMDLEYSFN